MLTGPLTPSNDVNFRCQLRFQADFASFPPSSRTTGFNMASRTHLPRQAAQAAKYTFDEPSDDEPEGPRGGEDSDEDEHARPAKKRKKGKGKVTGACNTPFRHSGVR